MRIQGKKVVPNFKIAISWRKEKPEEKVEVHVARKLFAYRLHLLGKEMEKRGGT